MQKGPVIGVLSRPSAQMSYARISWEGKRVDAPSSGMILTLRPNSIILHTPLQANQLQWLWKATEVVVYNKLSYARVEHKEDISAAKAAIFLTLHKDVVSFTCQDRCSLICYLGEKRVLQDLGRVVSLPNFQAEEISEREGVAITSRQSFPIPKLAYLSLACSPNMFPTLCLAFSHCRYISMCMCDDTRVEFTVVSY